MAVRPERKRRALHQQERAVEDLGQHLQRLSGPRPIGVTSSRTSTAAAPTNGRAARKKTACSTSTRARSRRSGPASSAPIRAASDRSDIQPDFYSGSAHKWPCGPKENGVLYINKSAQSKIWASIFSAYPGRVRSE